MSEQSHILRNSLLLSAAVTAGLHGWLEASGQGHGPRLEGMDPFMGTQTTETDLGVIDQGDPYIVVRTVPGEDTTHSEIVTKREQPAVGAMEYAREFSQDAAVDRINQASLTDTIESVERMKAEGYAVTLFVRGRVSAEDDSIDTLGGLQTSSQKNLELAGTRAKKYVEALEEAGLDGVSIEYLEPKEDTFTDTQVKTLVDMASQFGYDNVKALVDAWNLDPENTPPAVDNLLQDWLGGSHRSVSRQIVGTKHVEVAVPGEGKTEESCVQEVVHVFRKDTDQKIGDLTMPWGIPIMIGGMIVGIAGEIERDRRSRAAYRRERGLMVPMVSLPKVDTVTSGAGGGIGGGNTIADDPSASEQVEEIVDEFPEDIPEATTPPSDPPEKPNKPERRKWPWALPIPIALAIGGGVLVLHGCDAPASKPATPAVAPAPPDPCHGLPPKDKLVGTQVQIIRNGRYEKTENR